MASAMDTPLSQIPLLVDELRANFLTGKTRSVEYRKKQLKQLYFLIKDNEAAFVEAIRKDLGRPDMETDFGEITTIKNEIVEAVNMVSKWAKPTKVSTGAAFMLHTTKVRKDPQGTVLVLGAWNYPIAVQIGPVVSALVAGNTVVMKPSELSPHSAELIARLWPQYMDPDTSRIVLGGIEQSTALLDQRYEHILYTGNGRVGRIVAEKAAKWLCPVSLELGGKSPVIIDRTANLSIAAHRVLWAKSFNAGQTCIAPDYIIVERSVQDAFAAELKKAVREFWPSMDKNVKDFGRIVNERHWNRVRDMLTASRGETVVGGAADCDEATKFIPMSILKDVQPTDSTMEDEIFGPILPIMPVDSMREAVEYVNAHDQPLALYMFTSSQATKEYILTYTRSGAAIQGDMLIHFVMNELPFGGTGPSGYGAYHGKTGFDCFTHERAFIDAPSSGVVGTVVEKIMSLRYPPYSARNAAFFRAVLGYFAFFGRPSHPNESSTSIDRPLRKSVRPSH